MTTYTRYDWTAGDTITAARLDNIEAALDHAFGVAEQEIGYNSPLTLAATPPLVVDLCVKASAETIGSFTSDGYLVRPDGTPWSTTHCGHTRGYESGTLTTTTVDTLGINKAYLLPAHGACTVTALSGQLLLQVQGSSTTSVVDKVEILLIKVATDGTETTLDTTTITPSLSSASNQNIVSLDATFSDTYGAGYAVTTERLGVRIKVYGHSGTGATVYHYLNADDIDIYWAGGARVDIPRSTGFFSRLAFTFG